jgi:N-acetylglucosaminyldiphosphoundecaprenol N-acetyl-beta-D-mannosaminyltransferase
MYFRYGDPSWDSDAADSGAARHVGADRAPSAGPSPTNGNGNGNGHANGNGNGHRRRWRSPVHDLPTVDLRGVHINAITEVQSVRYIMSELAAGRGGMVVTPNLDHLHRCLHDIQFAALVSEAEMIVADGMPLVWASRLQGTPLPERVAGSNLISSLSKAAADEGRTVYLLGGAPGTAEGAARALQAKFPTLKIAGTICPPYGFENDPTMMAELIAAVSSARPDIVFVALGSPKQERLILKLRPLLPHAWWLGVGISFSFLSGDVRRAPVWMQKIGMEWIHRLVQEPRRLFRRYVVVGIPFAIELLSGAFIDGLPARWGRKKARAAGAAGSGAAPVGMASGGAPATLGDRLAPAPVSPAASLVFRVPASETAEVPPAPRIQAVESLAPAPLASVSDGDGRHPLSRLRALVLLGGSVRPTALGLATGRSVLDLPLDENGSVFNGWLDQAAELCRSLGLAELPVRVMVNQRSPEPNSAEPRHFGRFRVERDLSEYRGTGGVLHDLAKDYADDDLILVANAAQVLLDPLTSLAEALQRTGGDVTVVSHEDGTPSGIMLVACKTLREISEHGYVDMKEQALPQIASRFDVRVLARRRPTGLPIRTLEDYIQALRYHHRRKAGKRGVIDPLSEDWNPTFALVEPGAQVDPTARVHDSVVLKDAVVEAGAVLVRSVVCSAAYLRRDRTAVETFVTAAGDGRRGRRGFPIIPAGTERLAPAGVPAAAAQRDA